MASARDIRKTISEFVSQGKDLCQRMRSSERQMLNAVDLHVLRVQLQALDGEAANLEHLLSKGHLAAEEEQPARDKR